MQNKTTSLYTDGHITTVENPRLYVDDETGGNDLWLFLESLSSGKACQLARNDEAYLRIDKTIHHLSGNT